MLINLKKYIGKIDDWLPWSKAFKQFLESKDERWVRLLDEVEKLRGKPVKPTNETEWEAKLNLGDIEKFKKQLNRYLMSYTQGSALGVVDAGDVAGVLDA